MLAPTPSPMLVIWLWIAWVSYANVSDLDNKKKVASRFTWPLLGALGVQPIDFEMREQCTMTLRRVGNKTPGRCRLASLLLPTA